MDPTKKRILLGIGLALAVVLIVVIVLIVTLSTRGGGDAEELHLPERLNGSLCPKDYEDHPLLLVSLDGFRPDYFEFSQTPTLEMLASKGVHAEYMMPSYPTVTFPNHYTIVTGLYPESHGIIDNDFYDPEFKARFIFVSNTSLDGKWWGGEPIWNTVQKQGKKSATYYWPGSAADINGMRPNHYKFYDGSVPYEDKVIQVLEWLSLPADMRPTFVSLYLDEPDHAAHYHGPDSDEVKENLRRVDRTIDQLFKGLIDRDLLNCVNVIILSDHGMTKAGKENVIDLYDYIPNLKQEAYLEKSVVSRINLKNHTEEAELEILRKLTCKRSNSDMRVYQKEGLPKRMHYAKHPRIEDIVIEMDLGRTIQFNSTRALKGQHGYDNYFSDMNAIFLAYGPDFKQATKVKPFQNIELYNLMCYMMGVVPAENNGTWSSLHHLLANPPKDDTQRPAVPEPKVARFPDGDLRAFWNISGCEEGPYSPQNWMFPLKMLSDQEQTLRKKHLPWGFPLEGQDMEMVVIYHPNHITGYSETHKMPLWTSVTLNPEDTEAAWIQPPMDLWTSDFRLQPKNTQTCGTFRDLVEADYAMFTLAPTTVTAEKSGAKSISYLVSNAIPVHSDLKDEWLELMNILPHWIENQGPLNIVMGPIFDMNDNPHIKHLTDSGISVPSDLFLILTHCVEEVTSLDLCHPKHLDTRSFIFHQYQPVKNCFKSQEERLVKFSATVRDVEHFSHLSFYPNLPVADRIDLILEAHRDVWLLP